MRSGEINPVPQSSGELEAAETGIALQSPRENLCESVSYSVAKIGHLSLPGEVQIWVFQCK